jgi:hypothetical protein
MRPWSSEGGGCQPLSRKWQRTVALDGTGCGNRPCAMGFNRRKMEDQRRTAAEKESEAKGAAAWAALKRQSAGIDGSLITAKKKSSGDRSGLEVAAAKAALMICVFLLGVPAWRPPRLSPGFDPCIAVLLLSNNVND